MTPRGLAWLTVCALAALAILVGLGAWQLQRLAWKEALIERIESRARAEPVPLTDALRRHAQTGDVEYLRVRLSGWFAHDEERHLFTVVDGQAGWRVVTPLVTNDGQTVLVDRGFVPDRLKAPETRQEGQIEGHVELVGLARAPERQGAFAPDNEPERNAWFWRDLTGMAAGLKERQALLLAPFFVEAEKSDVPGGYPRGGVTRLDLPNRHLEYALTWFGLAAALVAVYFLFLFNRLRATRFTQ